jgi:hypothetical protein
MNVVYLGVVLVWGMLRDSGNEAKGGNFDAFSRGSEGAKLARPPHYRLPFMLHTFKGDDLMKVKDLNTPMTPGGLTPLELQTLRGLGSIANAFSKIVGQGPTRESDISEVFFHIHALQRMLMSQSAARAHPDELRLMGQLVSVSEKGETND